MIKLPSKKKSLIFLAVGLLVLAGTGYYVMKSQTKAATQTVTEEAVVEQGNLKLSWT